MNFINKNIKYLYITFFSLAFIVEVIYLLPSTIGDSPWFMSLSFNICRENLFMGIREIEYYRDVTHAKWVKHGWLMPYTLAKFNFFCSIRGVYLINFIIKMATSLVIFKILKRVEINNFFIAVIIIYVFLLQIKLDFRPETLSILIYLLIYIFFISKRYFLVGSLFALLFFTHIVMFLMVGLFALIYFYKDLFNLKYFFNCCIGFLIFLVILDLVYPYTILDYINGLLSNRFTRAGEGTAIITSNFEEWLKLFIHYWILTPFLPLWGLLFLILYTGISINNFWLLITLPFIWYFGPHVPIGDYYAQGLTPLLLILQYKASKGINIFFKYKKMFFYFFTIILIFSSTQIFSRNILTIIQHGNEFNYTKKFIEKNLKKIHHLPSFGSMLIEDWKIKDKDNQNFLYDLYSVNGSRNPCPGKLLEKKDHAIYIFNYKLFNSNSGYGIYICKK